MPLNDLQIQDRLKAIADLDKDFFREYSKQIHQNKLALLEKYPCSSSKRYVVPDIISESDSCCFCLGARICRRIYPEARLSEGLHAHQPRISIVIHLSQYDIHVMLTYILEWYKTIGLTYRLATWAFALLICLKEPVTRKTREFLSSLSRKFKSDQNSKTGAELVRLCYLVKCISSIVYLDKLKDAKKLIQYWKLTRSLYA